MSLIDQLTDAPHRAARYHCQLAIAAGVPAGDLDERIIGRCYGTPLTLPKRLTHRESANHSLGAPK